jgi:hypothetical protein
MPDSFPPLGWGPAPFDERDLDALLSGETADVPMALRQVADALAALRAAPTRAELSGESTIMAEFSALAEFRALGLSQAARDGGQARTLVLPVPPSDVDRGRGARHRSRGRAHRVNRRSGGLMVAAAAALIVAAVAVTGNLPGVSHRPMSLPGATKTPAPGARNSASPSLAARAAKSMPDHTATPSPSSSQGPSKVSTPSALCRSLFGSLAHPGLAGRVDWKAEEQAFDDLRKLAKGGPVQVAQFCDRHVPGLFPHGIFGLGGVVSQLWSLDPGQGNGNAGQGNQGQQTGPSQPSPPAPSNSPPANGTAKGSINPSGNGQGH